MSSRLVQRLVNGRLTASEMVLIDVGASGGIDRRWTAFGERLVAVGFDPLISEVERLRRLETRPKVTYEAARVGCREYDVLFPPALRSDQVAVRYNQPFERSSAVAAHEIEQKDYVREVFNAGAVVTYSDRTVVLDEYLTNWPARPNFLKIDTDGSDLQVLLGAPTLLTSPDLLGVEIECQFHGAVHDYANTFSNIDRVLRRNGFSLFDLDTYRYSRAALPAPFAIGIPAQTTGGQVLWGEAVYFRDLAHPAYEQMFGIAATQERLLKLCCLFSLYGLDDCAAELLANSDALNDLADSEELLDALTPRLFGDDTYAAYMARFREDPSAWLPDRIEATKQEAALPGPPRNDAANPGGNGESGVDVNSPVAGDDGAVGANATSSPESNALADQREQNERALVELRARVKRLEDRQEALQRKLHLRGEKIRRLRKRQSTSTGR